MKALLLYFFLLVLFTSCSDQNDACRNSFEVNKDNKIWKPIQIEAFVMPNGGLLIQVFSKTESITLTTTSAIARRYFLGKDNLESAVYEVKDTNSVVTYATGNAIGNGEIVITEFDEKNKTVSGTFKFNAENVFHIPLLNQFKDFKNGRFNKISVQTFPEEKLNIIVCDGDSRTAGYTGKVFYKYPDYLFLNSSFLIHNTATGGATFTNNENENVRWITNDAINVVTPKFSKTATNNILCIWAGYNDLSVREKSAGETFESLKSYCLARKKEGWKIILVNEPNHNNVSGEAKRLIFNELIKAESTELCDGLVDLGSNEHLGQPNAYLNTDYFFDGVHMTALGYNQVAYLIKNELIKIIKK